MEVTLPKAEFSRPATQHSGRIEAVAARWPSRQSYGGPSLGRSRRVVVARERPLGGISKRAFDLTVSVPALVVLSPLILVAAVLIKMSDRGPAFFAQERVGCNGRRFRCLKLRTMVRDGDEVLARHLQENDAARQEWNSTRKLKSDPRVTALGSFLRKISLDEIPQFFNVIRGDMSVVGPRPIVQAESRFYGKHLPLYLSTRPGITGFWQISGRNDLSYGSRVELDARYVRNWSLLTDVGIVIKTLPAVLMRRGSY